ncbi:hypothetical protein PMAYCL1PPCAC_01570, partial [Pristionchus mayeri]
KEDEPEKKVDEVCQKLAETLKGNPSTRLWHHFIDIIRRMLSKKENCPIIGARITIPLIRQMVDANFDVAEESTKIEAFFAPESKQLKHEDFLSKGVEALTSLCGMLMKLPDQFVLQLSLSFMIIFKQADF